MLTIDADTARQCLAFERLAPHCESPSSPAVRPLRAITITAWVTRATLRCCSCPRGRTLHGHQDRQRFPGNCQRGLPGLHARHLLCDANTGEHLALIDGDQITARRTAAASALAASYLARQDARELLILGAGRIGSLMAAAYGSVRPIERVRVWNRAAANAEQLVNALCGDGFDNAVVSDLEVAVQSADCVVGATLSTEPLILGEWLQPGVRVDLIGSFSPSMREANDAVFARGQVFVDVSGALHESGDLIEPIASGALDETDVLADLETLCRGGHPGRGHDDDITVFKAVGTALEDLASATLI